MKQENVVMRSSGEYFLNFYKFSLRELQSFNQLLQKNPNITVEEPHIKKRTCYKKIMEVTNFSLHYDYRQEVKVKELELLTAMIGNSSSVEAFNFKNVDIRAEHKMAIANLAKSTVLHTLCFGCTGLVYDPDIELVVAELEKSSSLRVVYMRFHESFSLPSEQADSIIKSLIKIPMIEKIIFQDERKTDSEWFVKEYNTKIQEIIAHYSKEKFYPYFQAFSNIPDVFLPIEIIKHIGDTYAKISSVEIEYSYDCNDT